MVKEAFHRKTELTTCPSTHTGVKPHNCTNCKNISSQKSQLGIHHRTHTVNAMTVEESSVRSHIFMDVRKFSQGRLCVCTECEKVFFQKPCFAGNWQTPTGETFSSFSRSQALFYFIFLDFVLLYFVSTKLSHMEHMIL